MSGDGAIVLTFVFDNVFVVLNCRAVGVELLLPIRAHYLGREAMLRTLKSTYRLMLRMSLLAVESCCRQSLLLTRHVIIGWSTECGRLRNDRRRWSPAPHVNLRKRLRHI